MELQLSVLYNKVFGIQPRRYPEFDTETRVLPYAPVQEMQVYEDTGLNEMKSIFGTPLFMPCKIDDYWLPNEPVITLTGGKNIVKTVVAGLKGTVKEEINTKDYIITIRGIIINEESNDYPQTDVIKLRQILEAQGSHEVVNRLFTIFGIDRIAIENFNIFGIAGEQSQQAYQINAVSDRPVELVIREGM